VIQKSVRGFLSRRRAGEARQGYLAQFPARFVADLGPIGQLRLASTNLQVASANRLADAPVVGLALLALDVKVILMQHRPVYFMRDYLYKIYRVA
jgi:hypothetical protein